MANAIRIAQVSTVHPAFDPRIFQKICVSLAKKGYSVSLIVPHARRETIDGVDIIPLMGIRLRALRMAILPSIAIFRALQLHAQVYHFHDPELLPWAWLLGLFGKNVIYDMHENVPAAILNKEWLHPRLRAPISRLWSHMERLCISQVSVVVAEESYLQDYEWHNDLQVIQNYPLLDLLEQLHTVKEETTTLVYVGHVHESRGSKVMLEVASLLAKTGARIKLLYVGYIPARHHAELKALAKSMRVDLHCTGPLTPREAWSRVSRCHIGFALLAPEPNYVNSYPTKLFEYMAMGLPAVVSNFPLYSRVIDMTGGGVAVEPKDVESIFSKVRPFVESPELCQKIGEKGRRSVRQLFNWGVEEKKLYSLYDRILSNNQRN